MDTPSQDSPSGHVPRQTVRRVVRFYYPNIEISGADRIPGTGPVLVCANHANSLLDPVLTGVALKRPVHFMAKAPLFAVPVLGPILQALGMLPAYRGSDDRSRETIRKNLESLEAAARCLAAGRVVGIFPEGKSHDLLHLEPVKSGPARLALQGLDLGARDLVVLPIGINYARKEQFRSAVWIRVGEPIRVADWLRERGLDTSKRAVRELTTELDGRLRDCVIHLTNPEWEDLLGELEALAPADRRTWGDPVAGLRRRQRIARALDHFTSTAPEASAALAAKLDQARAAARAEGLPLHAPVLMRTGGPLAGHLLWETWSLFLGFLPALLGSVFHAAPFAVERAANRFFGAPGRTTHALYRLLGGLVAYPAWYAFAWWLFAGYFRPAIATGICLALPFAGLFALRYCRNLLHQTGNLLRGLRLVVLRPQRHRELRSLLDPLRSELARHAADFEKVLAAKGEPPPPAPPRADWSWILRRTFRWAAGIVLAVALGLFSHALSRDDRLPEFRTDAPSLSSLSPAALEARLQEDESRLQAVLLSLEELEREMESTIAGFESGRYTFFNQADDDRIRRLLGGYLARRQELLRLLWQHRGYQELPDPKNRERSFLLALTAGTALWHYAGVLVERFRGAPNAIRKLNEPEPRWGIPADLYDLLRKHRAETRHREALEIHWARYDARQATGSDNRPFHAFLARARQADANRQGSEFQDRLELSLLEGAAAGRELLYLGQAQVSTWLSETRVRTGPDASPRPTPRQLEELAGQIRPGDVLLERQDWFLSRAFMPGYWAHAALLLGTREDVAALGFLSHPEVEQFFLREEAAGNHTRARLVLEAVPAGVRLTSLTHCLGVANSLAALRPDLPVSRRREALARALEHLGKPYDFDFDFFSSDRLVCTELVWRAYDGFVPLELVDVLGRRTLPPTELARQYARDRSNPDAPWRLVAFLDGHARPGRLVWGTPESFAATIDRPGLTWLQEPETRP